MRPSNLVYSVDERPPALVCLVNAAQQLTIITPFLIYPILVMREVGADQQTIANFVALSLACTLASAVLFQPALMGEPRKKRGEAEPKPDQVSEVAAE